MDKEVEKLLLEDIDEEVLNKLPEWFRILKEYYCKNYRLTFK